MFSNIFCLFFPIFSPCEKVTPDLSNKKREHFSFDVSIKVLIRIPAAMTFIFACSYFSFEFKCIVIGNILPFLS